MDRDVKRRGEIADLLSDGSHETIEGVLALARDFLGMDAGFVSEFVGDEQYYRAVDGEAASFGMGLDKHNPLEGTYCKAMTAGDLPSVLRDTRIDDRTARMAVTKIANVGAYVGVPIELSDGKLFGTMCCLSHDSEPTLRDRDIQFMRLLARLVGDQIEREALQLQNWRLQVESAGAGALMAALEQRDGYTGEHSGVVVELAGAVARELGLEESQVAEVEQVALLHDIGKIGIPDAILHKPGPLDRDEWELMQQHTAIGERIIRSIDGLSHLAPGIRSEHERWDGAGYPDQLAGEDIPLSSRIILVCDAYHAMVSDRPYRAAIEPDLAIAELSRNSGTQFDPTVVNALVACLDATRVRA